MFLLLGASTYVGQAFARALRRRKDAFIPLSRSAFDYARFEFLLDYVRKVKPELLINAAGTPEVPGQEVPEAERMEMLQTNTLLPQTIARVCEVTRTPWAHLSSGSIFSGAKIIDNGHSRFEEDLAAPTVRHLFTVHPEMFRGFSEADEPNFSFKAAPCTFYSGTKALAEEALTNTENYVWRVRLPFNEQDDPANFISQLLTAMTGGAQSRPPSPGLPAEAEFAKAGGEGRSEGGPTLSDGESASQLSERIGSNGNRAHDDSLSRGERAGVRGAGNSDSLSHGERAGVRGPSVSVRGSANILHDAINSLSQVDDCVSACLELWDRRAPYGIYNVVNPGAICTQDIVQKIQRILKPARQLQLLVYENGNGSNGEKIPRSDCILDVTKLLNTGIKLRPIEQAIDRALQQWQALKSEKREIVKS